MAVPVLKKRSEFLGTFYQPAARKARRRLVLRLPGSPIKNGHDALQSLEAIDMSLVTPTFLVTSRATHFSIAALKPTWP